MPLAGSPQHFAISLDPSRMRTSVSDAITVSCHPTAGWKAIVKMDIILSISVNASQQEIDIKET